MSIAQRFMPSATCSAAEMSRVLPLSMDSYMDLLVSWERYLLMFFLLNTLHP